MTPFTRFALLFFSVLWTVRFVILGLIGLIIIGAFVISYVEAMPIEDALYFSFVTGLTIGYGDIAPKAPVGRLVAILIGFVGILFTGLSVAASVQAVKELYKHK